MARVKLPTILRPHAGGVRDVDAKGRDSGPSQKEEGVEAAE